MLPKPRLGVQSHEDAIASNNDVIVKDTEENSYPIESEKRDEVGVNKAIVGQNPNLKNEIE